MKPDRETYRAPKYASDRVAKRYAIKAILAPRGIYQREAREAEGYAPLPSSLFGVVRTDKDTPWLLIHLVSGGVCDSALPPLTRKITLDDKLAVAAAWDAATELDWSAFDALPPATLEMTEAPEFRRERMNASQIYTMTRLRDLAGIAIAGGKGTKRR